MNGSRARWVIAATGASTERGSPVTHIEGFGERGGFGRRPALAVIDMTLGFTDPKSPLACDLEEPVKNIARLLDTARQAEIPVIFTTVAFREADKLTAAAFIEKVPALLVLEAGSRWAEIDPRFAPRALGARDIFIGVNALDYSGYPDCRPEFIAAFERVANLGTRTGVESDDPVRIRAPLIDMTKKEIIATGTRLGLDYALTSSCYDPDDDGKACGRCDACLLRLRGFEEAGLRDPAEYVAA